MTHTLHLPWPARPLWANDRSHWRKRSAAVKKARHDAWVLALDAGIKPGSIARPLLRFAFHPPTRRLPDLQNMPHTCKAAIDGIADALAMDDKHFLCAWPMAFSEPRKGGLVVVTVWDASLCVSCREPLKGAPGDSCASMTAHHY
jgi:crossover junction endodeoxyribonuclease RusA